MLQEDRDLLDAYADHVITATPVFIYNRNQALQWIIALGEKAFLSDPNPSLVIGLVDALKILGVGENEVLQAHTDLDHNLGRG